MRDLKTSLYLTLHSSDKSVEQLADECGVSANYMYKAVSEGPSSFRFPLDLLVPLMRATGDYRVLDHLNIRCDRLTVNAPRVRRLKRKDADTVNEIGKNFHEVLRQLLEFWQTGDGSKKVELVAAIQRHACDVQAMKKSVQEFEQGDLF